MLLFVLTIRNHLSCRCVLRGGSRYDSHMLRDAFGIAGKNKEGTFCMKLRMIALVAMLALFGVIARGPVSVAAATTAQDTATPAAGDGNLDVSKLDGIEQGVSRSYMGDMSALMGGMGTPGADASATPDFTSLGLFSMDGAIFRFSDDAKAKAAFGTLSDEVTRSLSNDAKVQLKDESVDGLGDNTKAFSGAVEAQGISTSVFVIMTQKDQFIYFTTGISFSKDANEVKDSTVNFTKALIDGKAGDGEGTVNADGTSTGGLWDKFPKADNEVLKGLKPMADQQIYPKK